MNEMIFIDVSGFFASGSSAVVDFLKEMDGFYECSAEVRLIKDPYGISHLETELVDHWDLINSTAAVSDYLDFCKKCARNGKGLFAPAGLGYSKTISKDFMEITERYIAALSDYTYKQDFYYHKFKKSYFKYVIDRWRWAVEYLSKGKLKTANRNLKPCYFAKPSREKFELETRKYLEELFKDHVKESNCHIILDQAVSPNNTQVIHKYFDKAKMIIIDRDPRDMYADDLRWGVNYDHDYRTREAGKRYALRQRALRSNMVLDDDVLYIRFEDLVLQYETTTNKILEFLGLPASAHINKKKYFNPSVSSKNIGIWHNYENECKDAFDAISEGCPELLFRQ